MFCSWTIILLTLLLFWPHSSFYKSAKIGNNGNNNLDLTFCSLSHWAMSYLGDLRSANGHALLVLTKWWCGNKRKFSDIISINICLNGSQTRVSDPKDWGPRFNLHWGNFLLLDILLFSDSKASDANIAIIANCVCLWKLN